MKYHYKPIGLSKVKKMNHTNASENVGQVELSYSAGENVNSYNRSGYSLEVFTRKN